MWQRGIVMALIVACAGLCGCPESPLREMIDEELNPPTDDSDSGRVAPVVLPVPDIISKSFQENAVYIEWEIHGNSDRDEPLGSVIFRSDEEDGDYVRQRAYAFFEEPVFVDNLGVPGVTYYYYVISVDRLGNESAPSEIVSVEVPVTKNQLVVHVGEEVGELDPSRLGVSDLNAAAVEFGSEALRLAVQRLETDWWRVGMTRWDPSVALTEALVEREIFLGRTLDDARDPELYQWSYLDRVLDNVLAVGATPIVTIDTMPSGLAENQELIFRAPVFSWSDNIRNSPPSDRSVFAEVVKRVIMHYTEGWGDGRELELPYWELWNAPDMGDSFGGAAHTFWTGSLQDYAEMYAVVHRVVKEHFGNTIKFGGAAFIKPTSVGAFVDMVRDEGVTPDFVSILAYEDSPEEIATALRTVKRALENRSLDDEIEIILSGWNMDLPIAGLNADEAFFNEQAKYDATRHAINYLGAFAAAMDHDVQIATHEGLRDQSAGLNLGLITDENKDKRVSFLAEALQVYRDQPMRLRTEPAEALALAGIDAEQAGLTVFMANQKDVDATFTIELRDLPIDDQTTYDWELTILSDVDLDDDEGFVGETFGSARGKDLNLAPRMPAYSIMRLEVRFRRAEDGASE